MTVTARNIGRINVWPTYDVARDADTAECKFIGQLTVWRTNEEAQANMTHEEDGGGGAPGWVPDGALIHIDLVGGTPQGRAWTQADGEVAVGTLLGADANTTSGWGTTDAYDPDNLRADGYIGSIAAIGALRTQLLAGATVVVPLSNGALANTYIDVTYVSATGNTAIDMIMIVPNTFQIESWWSAESETIEDMLNQSASGLNAIAFTLAPTPRAEVALNGSAASVLTVDAADWPTVGEDAIVAIVFAPSEDSAMMSITLYAALPDTDGLSELSEVA